MRGSVPEKSRRPTASPVQFVRGPRRSDARPPRIDSGLYQLVIAVPRTQAVTIGRLGRFSFPSGYYVYTGSAKRRLGSRVARHLRKRKKMRWHIDYLLRHGLVVEVKKQSGGVLSECELSRSVGGIQGSRVVVRGFGSSDCGCSTHLFHFQRNPTQELIAARLAALRSPRKSQVIGGAGRIE